MRAMTPQYKKSRIGLAIVLASSIAIPSEGMFPTWYIDPVGITTVCLGHTGPDIDKTKIYTKAECMGLLSQDMGNAVRQVDTCVPDLPLGVLAAFSDAAFNIGPKVACDTAHSTAARLLKAGDFVGACNQLPRWNKATFMGKVRELLGLTLRRTVEQEMCLKDAA